MKSEVASATTAARRLWARAANDCSAAAVAVETAAR